MLKYGVLGQDINPFGSEFYCFLNEAFQQSDYQDMCQFHKYMLPFQVVAV